jgi:hypothetical protein
LDWRNYIEKGERVFLYKVEEGRKEEMEEERKERKKRK